MKKAIKDMTATEKLARIKRLSLKFYDIDTVPSMLLFTESQRATPDETITHAIKRLETLEIMRHTLQDEYSKTATNALLPFNKSFRVQIDSMLREQNEKNSRAPHVSEQTQRAQQNALVILRRNQLIQREKIEHDAATALDSCEQQIYSVFMDAVRHLYR